MEQGRTAVVVDREGVRGTIIRWDPPTRERDEQVLLQLDDGRQIVVPPSLLRRQDDGSYLLTHRIAELDTDRYTGLEAGDERVIPVLEEELEIRKQAVETGRVRVTKTVHEREELVDVPLMQETVEIRRVPVERFVEGPLSVRREGDTTIVPLVQEVLVVEKRLMLKEEVHITRRRVETREPQRVTLRSEEATVERVEPDGTLKGGDVTEPTTRTR